MMPNLMAAQYMALVDYLEQESVPYADPSKTGDILWRSPNNVTQGYNPQGFVLIGMDGDIARNVSFQAVSVTYTLGLQLQTAAISAFDCEIDLLSWQELFLTKILPKLAQQGITASIAMGNQTIEVSKAFLDLAFEDSKISIEVKDSGAYGLLTIDGTFTQTFDTDIC